MSRKIKQNQNTSKSKKHMSLEDRHTIELRLKDGASLYAIAKELDVSCSTISREIKKHLIEYKSKKNNCANRYSCVKRHACGSLACRKKCRDCFACTKKCSDYVVFECERLINAPYCCNGCLNSKNCTFTKKKYSAKEADEMYRNDLINKRNGFAIDDEEMKRIDELVSPLIRERNLSPYHIKQALGSKLPVSESTLRRMIKESKLDARAIDMHLIVRRRFRRRPDKALQEKYRRMKVNHTWDDYRAYMEQNDIPTVQMDCVEGVRTDKCAILTLHFVQPHLQLGIILAEHTSEEVIKALDRIEEALGKELFREMFPLILTDNGHEFADRVGLERSIYGGKRTIVFYCEPNKSNEKGHCEKNHEHMRYVIPKGTSIDDLMQTDITLMMNHINSYKRKSLYGKCPYEVAMTTFPEDFFVNLGLDMIPAEEVDLSPKLLASK